jgi:predicted transposase/invertase (TIGR01784 family)
LDGERKGRLEGKIEGKLDVAKKALAKGASLEFIAGITGLDIETIRRL